MTAHTVMYAAVYIKCIVCNQCAYRVEKPVALLMWQYCHDLPGRAFSLALRLRREAFSHPILFAFSLPRRMIYKPIELSRELAEVCL